MRGVKYIGLDVNQATISVAVLDSAGKLVTESIVESKAATLPQFIQRGITIDRQSTISRRRSGLSRPGRDFHIGIRRQKIGNL